MQQGALLAQASGSVSRVVAFASSDGVEAVKHFQIFTFELLASIPMAWQGLVVLPSRSTFYSSNIRSNYSILSKAIINWLRRVSRSIYSGRRMTLSVIV
jgi:hypothetical protein